MRLNRPELMNAATAETGLDDFGDLPFTEALDVLLESLGCAVGSDEVGAQGAAQSIVRPLVTAFRTLYDAMAEVPAR
jgi:hypothetical protein